MILAQAGGVAGALGLAALILGTRRWQRLAGFGGWAAGMALLALHLAPHGHRGLLAGAAAVGLILAAIGAAVLVRWPWVLPFVALALLPARIPVSVGDTDANLLLPLYGVVAAAALALAWELPGEEARRRELGLLAWPLGLWIGWTGLSILWTQDVREASIELIFFVLPFGLLAVGVARLPWSRLGVVRLYGLLAFEALLFAAIGVYQWVTRDVFWNPKVIVPNAYANFYRVNSVFYDPSIYGRFLVVAILAGLVVAIRGATRGTAVTVVALIAATWVGLYYSYSQSSFVALIAGVLIAAGLLWRQRALYALAVTAVIVIGIGLASPHVRGVLSKRTTTSWNRATGGRASLVGNGARVALAHPAIGVGVGGFKRAYADRVGLKGKEPKAAASHDTPVTVAAETGFPGLLLYAWLVAAALWTALRPQGRRFAARASAAFGIMLAAIAVHSLFYNSFFEDPMVWGLFALIALAARVEGERA
ncbi:MAG TPA: O-antigen ligase family protein [Gaiellaceae bacterium]|nr:O-antigen ligase family protein [Gaiellaceae bacterium]